jgi:predicted  nucleic acid-binding Zn-ribbon protein
MSIHIDKFRQLVQANQQKQASSTVLDTRTATDLLHSITELQTKLINVQSELINVQKKLINTQTVDVEFDGENWSS